MIFCFVPRCFGRPLGYRIIAESSASNLAVVAGSVLFAVIFAAWFGTWFKRRERVLTMLQAGEGAWTARVGGVTKRNRPAPCVIRSCGGVVQVNYSRNVTSPFVVVAFDEDALVLFDCTRSGPASTFVYRDQTNAIVVSRVRGPQSLLAVSGDTGQQRLLQSSTVRSIGEQLQALSWPVQWDA